MPPPTAQQRGLRPSPAACSRTRSCLPPALLPLSSIAAPSCRPLAAPPQVILLSAVKYHVPQASWRGFYKPLWLGAALLNSGYSFFWDVERDWEISFFTQIGGRMLLGRCCWVPMGLLGGRALAVLVMLHVAAAAVAAAAAGMVAATPCGCQSSLACAAARQARDCYPLVSPIRAPPCPACPRAAGQQRGALVPAPVLRGALLFRRPFYLYLMASNLALRLAWTYKLSPHLRDHHLVVTLVVLAEVFRCVAGWPSCPPAGVPSPCSAGGCKAGAGRQRTAPQSRGGRGGGCMQARACACPGPLPEPLPAAHPLAPPPPPCSRPRRFQWLFVRIEVELRKIQAQRPEVGVLVPAAPHAYSALPPHPMDAGHPHASADADSGTEEEGGPRRGGAVGHAAASQRGGAVGHAAASQRGKDRKGGGAVRMLPLVDLNPQQR